MRILAMLAILAGSQAGEGAYLEVPIAGNFGDAVTARGVEDALRAAESMGVSHVVFTVDSRGGDPLVARDLYQVLAKHDARFRYHAVVREATGVAVAVLVWCDTVFIRPGGKLGGVDLPVDESLLPGVEPGVILLNLALMAGEDARRHGRSPELIRAMIDPAEQFNAFRDAEGRVRFSRDEPSVPRENLLLKHRAGRRLTLTEREAVDLEFARPYAGEVEDLGCELGLSGWVSAGEAGREAVIDAAEVERFRAEALRTDRRRFLEDQSRRRREAVKAGIERFLNLANEWNPRLGTYTTYRDHVHFWDGFWEGCPDDAARLTPQARRQWRQRTDATVGALSRARGGVLEMRELEKEAKALGLPPLYPEGKLEEIRLDLEFKIATLARERDRRFKDER